MTKIANNENGLGCTQPTPKKNRGAAVALQEYNLGKLMSAV
jgi:hypothetical protein